MLEILNERLESLSDQDKKKESSPLLNGIELGLICFPFNSSIWFDREVACGPTFLSTNSSSPGSLPLSVILIVN